MMQSTKRDRIFFNIFTFWFWFSNYILNPYMSPYAQSMGASNVVIGFVVSAYSVAQIALKIPLGIVSDRIGRKKVFIVLGAAISMLSELGMYLSASVGGLIAFRLLQGIAVASWVCATVLFASYLPADQAVNATVHLQIFNSAGTLTGYFAGGFITERFGYRSVFALAALGAVFALIFASIIRENRQKQEAPLTTRELVQVGRSPFLLLVTGVCMVGQMILSTTSWGFTPTLALELGASSSQISLISVCWSVSGLVCSMFIVRRLVKRLGEKRLIIIATALEAVFCFSQPFMPSILLLAINGALSGLTHSMSYSVLLGLSIRYFPGRARAAAMGFMQSLYCIGLFIGPVISGYFNDLYGLRAGFIVIGLLGFLAPAATWLFYETAEKKTISQTGAQQAG